MWMSYGTGGQGKDPGHYATYLILQDSIETRFYNLGWIFI